MDEVKQEIPIRFFKPWEYVQDIANHSIGREYELERLQADFENINRRLVVIEGVGGVGKTSFASQLAMKVSKHYKVLWIDCLGFPVTAERIFLEIGQFASEEYQYPKLSAIVENSVLSKTERAAELIEFLASLGKSSSNLAGENGLKPVALFFDGYHVVNDPALDQLISKIVECHIDVKVVLLIRQRLSLSQEIQTAMNAASTLRLSGLTLEDCRTLIGLYSTQYPAIDNLDLEMLYRIWKKTGGEPAVLRILIAVTRNISLTEMLQLLPDYNSTISLQQWFEILYHFIMAKDKDKVLEILSPILKILQDRRHSSEIIGLFEVNQTSSFPITQQSEQVIKDDDGKQKQIDNNNLSIYGQVQGLVLGEYNTITFNFQNGKKRSVPFLAPPQPSDDLVGRDKIMQELKQQLLSGKNLALSALNGLPGVGKTALALALAYDHEVLAYFCDGVLWAGLGREPSISSHLEAWGSALGIPQPKMKKLPDSTTLIEAIHRNIGTSRMLLVIDDAWSLEAALAFKSGGPNCAHLLTTRFPGVAETFAGNRSIVVQELGEDDGLTLLERLAPESAKTAPDEMRVLVHAVGGLPLSLTLMGKYLRIQMRTGQPRRFRTALDRLQQVKERLELSQPQGGLERHPSLPDGVPLSQLAVIEISDEALDEEARQTLRALSVFPSKPNTFSEEAALAIAAKSTKAIDTLADFGLLESSGQERYMLHQTISDYAKIELTDSTVYERMVKFFLKFVEDHKTNNSLLEREINNILAAVQIAFEKEMRQVDVSRFADFILILSRA